MLGAREKSVSSARHSNINYQTRERKPSKARHVSTNMRSAFEANARQRRAGSGGAEAEYENTTPPDVTENPEDPGLASLGPTNAPQRPLPAETAPQTRRTKAARSGAKRRHHSMAENLDEFGTFPAASYPVGDCRSIPQSVNGAITWRHNDVVCKKRSALSRMSPRTAYRRAPRVCLSGSFFRGYTCTPTILSRRRRTKTRQDAREDKALPDVRQPRRAARDSSRLQAPHIGKQPARRRCKKSSAGCKTTRSRVRQHPHRFSSVPTPVRKTKDDGTRNSAPRTTTSPPHGSDGGEGSRVARLPGNVVERGPSDLWERVAVHAGAIVCARSWCVHVYLRQASAQVDYQSVRQRVLPPFPRTAPTTQRETAAASEAHGQSLLAPLHVTHRSATASAHRLAKQPCRG